MCYNITHHIIQMKSYYKFLYSDNLFFITWISLLFAPIFALSEDVIYLKDILFTAIIFMIGLLFNIRKRIHLERYHIVAFLLFFVSSSFTLFQINADYTFTRFISYIFFLLLFCMLTTFNLSRERFIQFNRISLFVATLICFLIILSFYFDTPYIWGRYSLDILNIHRHPNYVVSYCVYPATILLCRFFFSNISKKSKTITLLLLFLFIIACLLSASRSTLLSIGICISALSLINIIKNKNLNTVIIVFSITIIAYFIAEYFIPERQFLRVSIGSGLTNSDNRLGGWSMAINEWLENGSIVFGLGIGYINSFLLNSSWGFVTHNLFLEILVDQGLIGLMSIIYIYFSNIPNKVFWYKMLIFTLGFILLLPLFFQNGYISATFWTVFINFKNLTRFLKKYELDDLL